MPIKVEETTTFICEDCEMELALTSTGKTRSKMQEIAQYAGWYTPQYEGECWCPSCIEKKRQEISP